MLCTFLGLLSNFGKPLSNFFPIKAVHFLGISRFHIQRPILNTLKWQYSVNLTSMSCKRSIMRFVLFLLMYFDQVSKKLNFPPVCSYTSLLIKYIINPQTHILPLFKFYLFLFWYDLKKKLLQFTSPCQNCFCWLHMDIFENNLYREFAIIFTALLMITLNRKNFRFELLINLGIWWLEEFSSCQLPALYISNLVSPPPPPTSQLL